MAVPMSCASLHAGTSTVTFTFNLPSFGRSGLAALSNRFRLPTRWLVLLRASPFCECELHFVFSPVKKVAARVRRVQALASVMTPLIEGPAPVSPGLLLIAGRLQPAGALNARRAAAGGAVDGERGVPGGGADQSHEILAMKVSL